VRSLGVEQTRVALTWPRIHLTIFSNPAGAAIDPCHEVLTLCIRFGDGLVESVRMSK
jgi:hypothetical protein